MRKYDTIIVGGGVIGKAITFKLSEIRPHSKILSVDPHYKANGSASYAAGAMLGAYAEITIDKTNKLDLEEINFRVQAQKYFPTWLEKIKERSGRDIYTTMGTFLIANVNGKQDLLNLKRIKNELATRNEQYEWIEPSDIPNFQPNPDYLAYQGLYVPNEGSINTSDLMDALDIAIMNSGVEHLNKIVSRVLIEHDKAVGIVVDGENIYADQVILCAGVGIQKILDTTNLSTKIPRLMPGKGVSLVVSSDIPFSNVIRTPNRDFACGTHIVPRSDSDIYIGATNRISNTPGLKDGITSGEVHSLLHSAIHEIHTGFRTANIEKLYFGSRPITTDRYPVVGETSVSGLYVATGTYRNGILMSPLIGDIVASEIVGENCHIDNPFSIEKRGLSLNNIKNNTEELITNGIRDLVSFIQEPTGALPYNRSQELTDFITILTTMVLNKEQNKYEELLIESRELIERYPVAEIVPQLFYKYHQVKEQERIK
ncbi:Thiazole synthase [Paenibacillus nuruki]|uniref:Thiazole synthase n=1 Tax=Paenibacillus nuruki TaxID=1886670 RepID=A0A1E3KWX9_9BACL|nr:FAD-dependent oxidoreductase [Paenibacillus nuruki]ODP26037.1 Thiazole synthase [Paenibacillus nuruki]